MRSSCGVLPAPQPPQKPPPPPPEYAVLVAPPIPNDLPYVCEPPKPEQLVTMPFAHELLPPSPAVKPPPTPPTMLFPPPPPPPATSTRVANDAAVAKALGPETVPPVEIAEIFSLTSEYLSVEPVVPVVATTAPSKGVPTPATITESPTLKP